MRRLTILVALWKRPELSRLMLEHTKAVAREANVGFFDSDEIDVHAIVSPDDPESIALVEELSVPHTVAANSPLSAKWGAGMASLEGLTGAVMILGSDDFLTAPVLRAAWDAIFRDHVDVFGFSDFFFLADGPRACWWPGYTSQPERLGEPMGAARTFSARSLDLLKWNPWPADLEKGLDGAAWQNVKAAQKFFDVSVRTVPIAATGGMLVDVKRKGEEHVCEFQSYIDTGSTEIPARVVAKHFPPALVEAWDLDPLPGFLVRREFGRNTDTPPRLALVMIAKDSEATIERAIRDAMPVIDDMTVVIDSRTSDRTMLVAREFGAAVYERPWEGFAAARNFAHKMTKAPFHLVLDSDESFDPGDLLEALAEAERRDADSVLVTVALTSGSGHVVPTLQPRVLRKGRFRWAFRRHNDVLDIKTSVQSTAIIRQSYVGVLEEKANAAILDLLDMFAHPSEPGVEPDAEKAHAAFHLARSHMALGNWALARQWARTCYELDGLRPERKYHMALSIEAWCLYCTEGHDSAEWFVTDAIRKWPDIADLRYVRICIDAKECWLHGMNPPGYLVTQPQHCLAFMPNFQAAMAAIGIGTQAREE